MQEALYDIRVQTGKTIRCAYDNVKIDEGDDTFIRFTINFNAIPERLTHDIQRQAGIAVCRVSTKVGVGSFESAQITDIIESSFTNLEWTDDSLKIDRVGITNLGVEDSHYSENVSIHFEYFK